MTDARQVVYRLNPWRRATVEEIEELIEELIEYGKLYVNYWIESEVKEPHPVISSVCPSPKHPGQSTKVGFVPDGSDAS